MSEQPTIEAWEDIKSEFKKKLITAVLVSFIGGLGATALAGWGVVKTWPGQYGLMPKGAVASFALESGCPVGWASYEPALSRFIIGAASMEALENMPSKYRKDTRDVDLSERPFEKSGGEQSSTVSVPQMPAHNHPVSTSPNASIHDGLGGSTWKGGIHHRYDRTAPSPKGWKAILPNILGKTGQGQPHNNMPPYIALYYCIKK